ncbi:uncharacterized protein LOC111375257 [Olea europaea var. sylvestris]|uniref:uncharacterized protein LOC111375257 n=1 Tax=Olea europaea var. sylvestris TaxID=158386 RepID=UPI000C1CF1B8|nr:uncharacterized protein LOC111375257 [Olea europaea var. sylvestris]
MELIEKFFPQAMLDHKETEFVRLASQAILYLNVLSATSFTKENGQPGHVASSCPSIKKPKQEKKGKARVFALTHEEAAKNLDVIACILSVSNISVYILIDSGATHSFISNVCLAKINASCQKNASVLEVSMPSGGTIDTNRIAKGVQIDFDGLTLEADLYVIEMKDFDIFLGMDWLGENRAMIVCFEKEVIFRRLGEEEF